MSEVVRIDSLGVAVKKLVENFEFTQSQSGEVKMMPKNTAENPKR